MANTSQVDQPTGTDIQFKISAATRRHKKKKDTMEKYISANKDHDGIIIDTAIKLANDESNVMEKHNITKERQVNIYETPT